MPGYLIQKATIRGREGFWDLSIDHGIVSAIERHLDNSGYDIVDGRGRMVSLPFVDPHIHLDSALSVGRPRFNESGTLLEGIELWSEFQSTLTEEQLYTTAETAVKWHMAQGVLALRTHVDISDPELMALKVIKKLKDTYKERVEIQIAAFPQEGIPSYYGALENIKKAIRLGVDVLGAAPHLEHTREMGLESLHSIFELALSSALRLDIHCDETDDDQSRFLETVAALSIKNNLGRRVTVSHTTAMHSYNAAYALKIMALSKRAGIGFISNPLSNLTLQGRSDTYPKRRGLTRIKELYDMGIPIALGHDNLMDPFYPFGTGNMLEVANMCIHAAQMTGTKEVEAVYDMITSDALKVIGLDTFFRLEVGAPADLILIDAPSASEAIRRRASVVSVFRNGVLLASTAPATTRLSDGEILTFSIE